MNSDWYINQGFSHKVCEDYAVAGDGYAVVSDGCSSSENTDVGARILCLLAQQLISTFLKQHSREALGYDFLGTYVISRATQIASTLGLPPSCLDATLLAAFVYRGKIYVYAYGDGYIVINYDNGEQRKIKFEFPQNAPYYLTYSCDFARDAQYRILAGEYFKVFTWQKTYWDMRRMRVGDPIEIIEPVDEVSNVLVMSDGVESFLDKSSGEAKNVPDTTILKELTSFKLLKGEFVKRRAQKAIKNYTKNGITHYDDLSIGGINLEGLPKRKGRSHKLVKQ